MATVDGVLEEIRRSTAAREAILEGEPALVVKAIRAGARQKDIAEAFDRTREWVRKIARAQGITPVED